MEEHIELDLPALAARFPANVASPAAAGGADGAGEEEGPDEADSADAADAASADLEPPEGHPLLEAAVEACRRLGLEPQPGGPGVRRARHVGFNGRWDLFLLLRAAGGAETLAAYSALEDLVPSAKLADVGEFLHRANFGLPLGNFELDCDDGAVRFRTQVESAIGLPPPEAQLHAAIAANLQVTDRYLPGLRAVLMFDVPPAAAVRRIEAGAARQDRASRQD